MTPPHVSSNSLLNSEDQHDPHDSHESVSGTRNEEVECSSNEEDLKLSACSETTGERSGRDPPSSASYHGTIGTKHLLSNGEDEIDGSSKKRKSEKLTETAKATENTKKSVQPEKVKTESLDKGRSQPLETDGWNSAKSSAMSANREDEVDFVTKDEVTTQLISHKKQSPKHQKHEDTVQHSPSSTMEEEVLSVLFGTYFGAREEELHLLGALQAVVRASGGSLHTTQFLTEICCAVDRDFVAQLVFQCESLTQTVARWVVDWINTQDIPSTRLLRLLPWFVCGNAPLAAGHLLLQNVDANSLLVVCGLEYPVGVHCLRERGLEADANDLRLLLVVRRVDLSWRNDRGKSLLHYAAQYNHLGITKFLVKQSMDVNQQDLRGRSALMIAIKRGHTEISKFLASSPLSNNLGLIDRRGWNAFAYAVFFNELEVFAVLVNHRSYDPNRRNGSGRSDLMMVIQRGFTPGVARLLALHPLVNLDLQDSFCYTPLHYAAFHNDLDVVELLVNELKVEVNQQAEPSGQSALMLAIQQGHTEVARLLALHPSARLELQDVNGQDARSYAAHFDRPEVSGILESRCNEIIARDTN